jgi:probable rRNA maturation factor
MVLNRQNRVRVPLRALEEFLRRLRREPRLDGRDVTVCLVTDAEIARLNRTFRGKHGPTDVLSFPANENPPRKKSREAGRQGRKSPARGRRRERGPEFEDGYLGDIAISPETAQRHARRLSHPLKEELRVLVLHGVLHLLGYDHETDHGEMERLENRLRRRLKLERG